LNSPEANETHSTLPVDHNTTSVAEETMVLRDDEV